MNLPIVDCSSSRPTLVNCAAIIFVVDVCAMLHAAAILLAPVHWNASNPTFKSSRNSLTIEVNLYDGIDFICPFYDNTTDSGSSSSSSDLEYYVIYMVSKRSYDTCRLLDDDAVTMVILNCSTPRQPRRYTILFEPFQAIPNAPEFHRGHSYFFVTTSTGRKDGLTNADGGACYHHNMKLIVTVCCQSSSSIPSVITSTVPSTSSPFSSRKQPSQSSVDVDRGVGSSRASYTSLLSTHIRSSSTTTSVVVIHVDPSTSRQHGDELFSRRSTSRTTTTAKHPVSDTAHLPSLSCTHYSSNSIFYVSLLQILAFSYLLS